LTDEAFYFEITCQHIDQSHGIVKIK
jgi:hypothetical protein